MRWIVAIAALFIGAVPPAPEPVAAAAVQPEPALDEALQALASIDTGRLHSDKAYAEAMLAHLDTALPAAGRDAEILANFQLMRATALATLGRKEEAVAAARKAVAARPGDGSIQAEAVLQAARADRPAAAIDLLEAAVGSVRDADQRALLRQGLSEELVFWLQREFYDSKSKPDEVRLATALLALQWPAPDRAAMLDGFRRTVIRARITEDVPGARALLAEMTDPASLLPLLVSRRFDPLFASDAERLARLDAAIRGFDKSSADRLRLDPDDSDATLERRRSSPSTWTSIPI